jgi:cytoskeletal protein CcmA (bactofilin family)
MKFSLGRAKFGFGNSGEQETINRWREVAMQSSEVESSAEPEFDFPPAAWPEEAIQHRENNQRPIAKILELGSKKIDSVVKADIKQDSSNNVLSINEGNNTFAQPTNQVKGLNGQLKTALGSGTVIQGKLTFDAPVRIDGTLNGEVYSTSTLVVGNSGTIRANVEVGSLITYGHVIGPVHASEVVEIRRGGRIEGDISTARIVIEEGGYFQGHCHMKD